MVAVPVNTPDPVSKFVAPSPPGFVSTNGVIQSVGSIAVLVAVRLIAFPLS